MAKAFSWSFSKLKNFETCPRRYYEVDINRNYKESSEQLDWGNEVHAKLAQACEGKAELPISMQPYQKYVNTVRNMAGELKVEQKYAITKDMQPTAWFAPNAWYRGVADVARILPEHIIALDWKTGKVPKENPHTQLMLMAQCLFSHFPTTQQVTTAYVWLNEDAQTPHVYTRAEVAQNWLELLPRVQRLEEATIKQEFPPKPGGLCRSYCPVQSCPFWGKGVAR
jgi:RecB family exonuclease